MCMRIYIAFDLGVVWAPVLHLLNVMLFEKVKIDYKYFGVHRTWSPAV